MAVASIGPIRAVRVLGGYDIPHSSENEEAATQTYKAGAPLVFSSGTLTEGTSDTLTGIVGIAENDGQNLAAAGFYTGTTTTFGQTVSIVGAPNQGPLVALALPNVVFQGHLAGTTSSDPNTATSLAIADIGVTYDIVKATTSKLWYVDRTSTGNKRVVVVGLKDAVGTVSGVVYFMFLLTATFTIYA